MWAIGFIHKIEDSTLYITINRECQDIPYVNSSNECFNLMEIIGLEFIADHEELSKMIRGLKKTNIEIDSICHFSQLDLNKVRLLNGHSWEQDSLLAIATQDFRTPKYYQYYNYRKKNTFYENSIADEIIDDIVRGGNNIDRIIKGYVDGISIEDLVNKRRTRLVEHISFIDGYDDEGPFEHFFHKRHVFKTQYRDSYLDELLMYSYHMETYEEHEEHNSYRYTYKRTIKVLDDILHETDLEQSNEKIAKRALKEYSKEEHLRVITQMANSLQHGYEESRKNAYYMVSNYLGYIVSDESAYNKQ